MLGDHHINTRSLPRKPQSLAFSKGRYNDIVDPNPVIPADAGTQNQQSTPCHPIPPTTTVPFPQRKGMPGAARGNTHTTNRHQPTR